MSYHEIHSSQKKRDIYTYIRMKIERETIKYEIGNFMISMKYYIAKRRRRYFISWDTSKTEKMIYIYINEDWDRDNQIWDRQLHDITEISYRKKKKTIFHCMRYIKFTFNNIYINEKRERDDQIWDWQFHNINEIFYRQKKKTIIRVMRYIKFKMNDVYIYIRRKRGRDDLIWDWQFHDINDILYRRKKKTIFHIMR